jgi:hypothetical protein
VFHLDVPFAVCPGDRQRAWLSVLCWQGEWIDDLPHGPGTYTDVNVKGHDGELGREIFEGLFEAGHRRDGEGTMYYANGDVYVGAWAAPTSGRTHPQKSARQACGWGWWAGDAFLTHTPHTCAIDVRCRRVQGSDAARAGEDAV